MEAVNQLVTMDLEAKDFAEATRRVQRQMEKSPNDAVSNLLEGKVRTAKKEWKEAEAAVRKAIDLNPNLASAYDLLVTIYLVTDRLPLARRELEAILSKSPNNPAAWMTLATIEEKQTDYAKAAEAYEKLLTFKPDFVPALNNLAYLYVERLNQLDKAQRLARKARTLAPGDPSVADTLGWVLLKRKQYQEALSYSEEAADKIPNNPESPISFGYGALYDGTGGWGPKRFSTSAECVGRISRQGGSAASARVAQPIRQRRCSYLPAAGGGG